MTDHITTEERLTLMLLHARKEAAAARLDAVTIALETTAARVFAAHQADPAHDRIDLETGAITRNVDQADKAAP